MTTMADRNTPQMLAIVLLLFHCAKGISPSDDYFIERLNFGDGVSLLRF